MYFTKASLHEDGTMHWAATVSDTDVDNHGERVDRAFFDNAVSHAEDMGIMPYMCVSHYDFAGKGVPDEDWIAGPSTVIFPDGKKFKAKGTFWDTELGRTSFKAVQDDIKNNVPHDERARISMGFYDRTAEEQKSEVIGNGETRRVYMDGIIKHFALTRVPVLPRTEVEAWREKSMTTKREDAASIIGDDLAEKLDTYSKQVGKSEADEELVVKGEEVEKAKRKKVDEDFEYEKEEPGKETMAEEMWTETPEEAEVPGLDQEAKKASEEELKKRKKKKKSEAVEKARGEGGPAECTCPCGATAPHEAGTPCASVTCPECGEKMRGAAEKAELVELMIKEEDGEVVLYSKDGKKVLGRFPYGEGKKHKDKKAARAAAHKQEGVVQAIKAGKFRGGKKSEALEEVSATEVEEEAVEESEAIEKAGRKVSDKRLKAFEDMQRRMSELGTNLVQLNTDMQTWYDDAQYTPEAIVNTSTEMQPLPENPAIAILEGTPATAGEVVAASDFDENMTKFAEEVYNTVTEGTPEVAQQAMYDIADAIKSEIESSMAEVSDSEVAPEESVEAEEVEQSATTPLDVFQYRVKSVLGSEELDRRAKLQACQEALVDMGNWIQNSVIQETPPSMGDIREVIVAAVNEGTRPLVQENAALKAELEEVKRLVQGQPTMEQAPVRKSMFKSEGAPVQVKENYSAAEIARMTPLPPGTIY
jgi:hypothetical protein